MQLIHSNPVNVAFTSQFTCLIRKVSDPEFKVWSSNALQQATVVDGTVFKADRFSIEPSKDFTSYQFTALSAEDVQVNLTFTRESDGFKIGKDGVSKYGTDPKAPWGTMRHIFWPRCKVDGTILLPKKNTLIDFSKHESLGLFVMALQGMKPHHAAARWNFVEFQGPTTSVTAMQFETPVSYGRGRSSIGAIVKDGKLLATAVNVEIEHTESERDSAVAVGWPRPTAIKFVLQGPKAASKTAEPEVKCELSGKLDFLVERLDVMAELPTFVKRVASGVSGTNPIIYQYFNKLTAKVTVDGETHEEQGHAFSEATFIS